MLENIGKYFIINGRIKIASDYHHADYDKRIYEVIRIVNGEPLFLEDHFERLMHSSESVGKPLQLDIEKLRNDIQNLIETEQVMNNNIMLIIYYSGDNYWYILYLRKSFYPCADMYRKGVETSLLQLVRSEPNAKVLNMSFRDIVKAEIFDKQVFETILVNNNGYVTEGSKTNLFFTNGREIITTPREVILLGITRKYVINIIKELGYTLKERMISKEELTSFDGAFLTGTSIGVLPVRLLDDIEYNSGDNPIIIDVHRKYNEFVKAEIRKC